MRGRVVITGGSGALALAAHAVFRDAGWQVDAPARAELDVTRPEEVAGWFRGREDIELLICAAGTTEDMLLARMKEENWDRVMEVNLHGAARCAAAVLPGMMARGEGHIIFLSSHSAVHPPAGQAAYAAAKAGLLGLTKSLAREAGPAGVRINAALPGFLETRMTATLSDTRKEQVRAEHALGRFNTPAAVARFLRMLHEDLPHTSGQVFQLDSRIS